MVLGVNKTCWSRQLRASRLNNLRGGPPNLRHCCLAHILQHILRHRKKTIDLDPPQVGRSPGGHSSVPPLPFDKINQNIHVRVDADNTIVVGNTYSNLQRNQCISVVGHLDSIVALVHVHAAMVFVYRSQFMFLRCFISLESVICLQNAKI